MKQQFYEIVGAYKRSAIKIQSDIEYNSLRVMDKSTPLISQNTFTIDAGKKSFDLLEFADSQFFAISQRFKDLLESNKILGYESFPIVIHGLDIQYYGIFINSFAGPITNLEDLNDFVTERTEFDQSTWDGSDIFNLQNTLVIACTARVKEIIESNKLTNVEVIPL